MSHDSRRVPCACHGLDLAARSESQAAFRATVLHSGLLLALAIFGLLLSPSPGRGETVDWSFYEASCGEGVRSALSVSCGPLGVLHFDVSDSADCGTVAGGRETAVGYARPQGIAGMPARATDSPGDAESSLSEGWVAVVDWADEHGFGVQEIIGLMAEERVRSRLYALDDPALAPLGESVGDQHVLAKLCEVLEDEALAPEPLLAVNMSFGRLQESDDPVSDSCAGGLACQLAKVLGYLRERGATPVAAAGNHQRLLFPASLDETLAAGAIDMYEYGAQGRPRALWESPRSPDALLPGHALCTEHGVAPAGSSFAGAVFSGWLARVALEEPALDAFAAQWLPILSRTEDCFILAQEGRIFETCSAGVRRVMSGLLAGGRESGCWSESGVGRDEMLTVFPGDEEIPPGIPSLPEWAAEQHHPTPESDPCIPCVGNKFNRRFAEGIGVSPSLLINLTASTGLATGISLDRVFLRVGEGFYPLSLDGQGLEALAAGSIQGMLVGGLDRLPAITAQPSLIFILKTDPLADCDADFTGSCYWTSTPVMLR